MKITVILCTYDRCQTLEKALSSLAASRLPESVDWEVLVVDNNSRDQTRAVVEAFCRRYPGRFRYLLESRQGKSYALNTGIREARGEVLAFVDDDVTVDPDWVKNLTANLFDGEWAGAGGRILPASVVTPPRWLALKGKYSHAGLLYAHFDLGEQPLQLERPPYGASMAFRKEMFERHGGFLTDLGPGPNRAVPRFGEDTEFGYRLMSAGGKLRYEPSAVAYHEVPLERIRKTHFLTSWFELGRYSIVQGGGRPDVWGIPRHYLSAPYKLGVMCLRALRWAVTFDPERRFYYKCSVWMSAGYLVETCRQSRRKESRASMAEAADTSSDG